MTYLEKFKEIYPDWEYTDILRQCPQDLDIFNHSIVNVEQCSKYCEELDGNCQGCWNQEIPEEEPIVKEEVEEFLEEVVESPKFEELPHILDSGDRTEFESGAVRDMREGKGRCDLLPLDVVCEMFKLEDNPRAYTTLWHISEFEKTGDIECLYNVLMMSPMFDCDYTMILETAIHFEEGAKKYGPDNWTRGIPVRVYIDSAIRHFLKFLRGDTDERHDRAVCWNIMCAIWTCKHIPELNDYAK